MPKSPSERRAAMVRLVESKTVQRVAPPLLVPAGPYLDLAGEEFGRQLLLTTANDGIEYCLRPDFTLPIAKSYLDDGMLGVPGAFTYFGPIFRQENGVPVEYDQAGLELLGQPDASSALDQVLTFARWALAIYDVTAPSIRLGGVGLFESFLAAMGISPQWQARIPPPLRPSDGARPADAAAGEPGDPRRRRHARCARQHYRDRHRQHAVGGPDAGGLAPARRNRRPLHRKAGARRLAHSDEMVQLLVEYLAVIDTPQRALDRIWQMTREAGLDLEEPLNMVRSHAAALIALSPKADVIFDAGFSPRLDYYTGVVFEMTGENGQILASGGEYDRLLDRLGATEPVTASGCALWTDRLEAEAAR